VLFLLIERFQGKRDAPFEQIWLRVKPFAA
jgi:hypothetical protein